jgi:hypothetical protein
MEYIQLQYNTMQHTFAYTFTGTGQLIIPVNAIIDILLVGAGGRGGIGAYAGGGGAGEVVYYPQSYNFSRDL